MYRCESSAMYQFKVVAVRKDGMVITKEVVVAPSMGAVKTEIAKKLWWDCYEPRDYELSFISKTRI